ncbi:MAG: tetratricopeptide repeat protein [Spirochaetaceae bacterium]|jgi:TolA-binding protein|nr:tetratricopeptide repeat protein [Spirochaetaceae bacterium]
MTRKTCILCLFLLAFLVGVGAQSAGSSGSAYFKSRLQSGIELYADGKWGEAVTELRRFQMEVADPASRAEAQFWVAMAQMSAGQYEDAVHDFDEVPRIDPRSPRVLELPYQKARSFYYLGRFNEAIVLFRQYADGIRPDGRYVNGVRADNWNAQSAAVNAGDEYNRKAAAVYWIGECLFSLEEFEKAEEMFAVVVGQYAKSYKYESSVNRIALIKQKKVEAQLLEIMRQNGEKKPGGGGLSSASGDKAGASGAYEDALGAYQQSIAPYLTQDASKERYTPSGVLPGGRGTAPGTDPNTVMRLLAVKTQALEMMERLMTTLNAFENLEYGRW